MSENNKEESKISTKTHDELRAYYNFIRKHQSSDGKTPAEMANIDLRLEGNKWLALIQKASKKS